MSWQRLVVRGPGDWAIETLEDIPVPGDGEVLIHSVAFGLCGTDMEVLRGDLPDRWITYPCSPGHEWVGHVEALGSGVDELVIGDAVAIEAMNPCLACERCRSGETNLCQNYDQFGFTKPGGSSEYSVVPARLAHRLPETTVLETAVVLEPTAVMLQAIGRVQPQPGESVGVIGLGSLGLISLRLLQLRSPRSLVALGLHPVELDHARSSGANHVVDVSDDDAVEAISGLDVVVVTAGSELALALAVRIAREGGRIVSVGLAPSDAPLPVSPNVIVLKDLTIIGSVTYRSAHWHEAITLLDSGMLDPGNFVAGVLPISRVDEAISLVHDAGRVPGRIVVTHEPTEP